ncbi:MAG: class II fructose-bisphosphate aldolase [Pleomorphochaeta sp.]
MLVNVKAQLELAKEKNTAVIGFICMDYVMARTVVYAAEATNTPAMIMLYPEHITIQHTTGRKTFAEMVKELANEVEVPISVHMDHDFTYESVMKSIDAGFGSVMFDGSIKPIEENIALTKKVVEVAHAKGICVEGEIGHVGSASTSDNKLEDYFTTVESAVKFCSETGVDSLAISIGNAHGEYVTVPNLDIDRLIAINNATETALALHGGSGIPDDQLKIAFSNGINKFNLGTDFLKLYFKAVEEFVEVNRENKDPVKIIDMPEFVQSKLQPYVEDRLRTLCNF